MLHHMLRAAAQRAFSVLDPYFQYVTMLLHGDGTNGAQNNTFLDSSTNNFTITRNGNTTQGTFTPYGSNWSNASFSGSNYLTYNPGSSAAFGTGDFTVEAWVFATDALASGDNPYICDTRGGGGAWSLSWNYNGTSNPWQLAWANSSVLQSSTSMNINTWNHCAYVRSGTTGTLYLNGVSIATWTDNYNYSASVTSITIGRRNSLSTGTQYLPGYLSNFRIVKGTAVYSSSFTPSTAPLTAITNTVLLTCQSNRFIDNSSNAFTVTPTGSPSVQRFSPFSPTTAYSTSVIGGSGYFDGSGDYLESPSNSSVSAWSTDFTVEGWYYPTVINAGSNALWTNSTSNSDGMTYAYVTSSGAVALGRVGVNETASASGVITTNRWIHIAFVRNGGSVNIYVNGTSVATPSTGNLETTTTKPITIGGEFQSGGGDFNFTGYIADFRVVKGTAVYTSSFTPPTAPLTAITNTSLLLSYTNAGILDNAMMNDLETVGNAQISTSIKKYGTGSMYFDGTGDYLTSPVSPNNALGSGNFTIEGYHYCTGYNGGAAIYSTINTYPSSSGLLFYISNLGVYTIDVNGTILAGSGTAALNTWVYFAVVRNSSTLTIYIDGTSIGSVSSSTNFTDQYAVIGRTGAGSASNYFLGYIDDLRITKGVARYTTTFTPPTAAFPNN